MAGIVVLDRKDCPYYPRSTPLTPEEQKMMFFQRILNAYNQDNFVRAEVDRMFATLADTEVYKRKKENKNFLPRRVDDEYAI